MFGPEHPHNEAITRVSTDIVPLRQAGDMTTREAMQAAVCFPWLSGTRAMFQVVSKICEALGICV